MESRSNTILVATNNRHKIPEIVNNLALGDWTYSTLGEVGITEAVEETGETYEANARIKARFSREHTSLAVLADDSGLEVDALGGAPGVYSARYAGQESTDLCNIEKLLEELKGVPAERRTARFVCHIIYIDEKGNELVVKGVCEGRIADEACGEQGFGYDPVFLPEALTDGRTMAQLTPEEKNSISHRGKALRALRRKLLVHYGLPGQTPPVRIAAFDFDGTVLEGHSPVRLIRALALRGDIPYRTALKAALWGLRYKARMKVEQKQPREYLFGSFSHLSVEEVDGLMSSFYHDDLQERLRPQALAALEEHRQQGDMVVFVSASFYPILKEAARDVQAGWFICTQMEIVNDVYTGNVKGLPPEGRQKPVQLSAWADETFGEGAWELAAAYGDHYSDEALLAAAKQAIAVNPDTRLEKAAKREGWRIVDWSLGS